MPSSSSSSSSGTGKGNQTTAAAATAGATGAVDSIGSDSLVHKARMNAKTSLIDNYNTDYSYTTYDNNFEKPYDTYCSSPSSNSNTNTVSGPRALPWHSKKTEVGWTDRNDYY